MPTSRAARLLSMLLVLLACLCSACATAPEGAPAAVDATAIARGFVETVAQKDYAGAVAKLDTVERMGLPESRLKNIWETLIAQYGEFQSQAVEGTGTSARGQTVTIKCSFERGATTVNVTVNNSGQISGVAFTDS